MAGTVFFSLTMSLDAFVAPEERMDDPDAPRWMAQWTELQQWIFPQRFFRENLKLGEGGETLVPSHCSRRARGVVRPGWCDPGRTNLWSASL